MAIGASYPMARSDRPLNEQLLSKPKGGNHERLAGSAAQHPGVLCVADDRDDGAFYAFVVVDVCGGGEMTIWNWLLVTGCLLLWTACVLLLGRLTSEWKRVEQQAEERECRRKWGVETW